MQETPRSSLEAAKARKTGWQVLSNLFLSCARKTRRRNEVLCLPSSRLAGFLQTTSYLIIVLLKPSSFFFLILRVYIFFFCFLLFITVVYATYDVLKRTFFFVSSKSRCVAGEDCRRVLVLAFLLFFFYLCLHLPDYGSLLWLAFSGTLEREEKENSKSVQRKKKRRKKKGKPLNIQVKVLRWAFAHPFLCT